MVGTWSGKNLSPEHKEKVIKTLTSFKKGHKGYWLGKKRSQEDREKMSKAKIGKPAPWNRKIGNGKKKTIS